MLLCAQVREAANIEQSTGTLDPLEQFKSSTRKKLDGLTCSSHGKAPVIDFQGGSLRDIRISMRCCCGKLSTLANQAIARTS